MKRTQEEELCGMLKEGRCVAGQELENARQVIRDLREEKTGMENAWAEETRALEQCEKDAVKSDEEIARLDTELEKQTRIVKSVAVMLGWENVPPQATLERDISAMKARIALSDDEIGKLREWRSSERQTWAEETAALEKRVNEAELTESGVIEGSAEWEDDCKTAQKEVQELRKTLEVSQQSRTGLVETISCYAAALERINEIRNNVIGRQHAIWSWDIYGLVAALDAVGFEGMGYDKAREKVEATIKAAREMAAGAWGQEETKDSGMDVHVAEEFAEILLPFLETLEFYASFNNWQSFTSDAHESACDMDLGGRARATLGRPDRDVPEIIEDDDEENTCANCGCCKEDGDVGGPAEHHPPMPFRMHCSKSVFLSCAGDGGFKHWVTIACPLSQEEADERSGTGGGPSGDGS